MISALELLHKYATAFRALINVKVWTSEQEIKQSLRLNSSRDWDFLCAAMDIIDDASGAIDHVQKYGLSGPTKYQDTGEKYLRLYGLLSAAYIQQQSIREIYRIMNAPNPKDWKKRFDALEIRSLRHKLAAHGTDYKNEETNQVEAYVPVRISLGDDQISYVNSSKSLQHKTVNLTPAIEAHSRLMIEALDTILDKSIKTILKGHDKKKKEAEEKLSDLRIEREGGLVFGGDGRGPKIIVTFVNPKAR